MSKTCPGVSSDELMMETLQVAVGSLSKAKSEPNIWQRCAKIVRNVNMISIAMLFILNFNH